MSFDRLDTEIPRSTDPPGHVPAPRGNKGDILVPPPTFKQYRNTAGDPLFEIYEYLRADGTQGSDLRDFAPISDNEYIEGPDGRYYMAGSQEKRDAIDNADPEFVTENMGTGINDDGSPVLDANQVRNIRAWETALPAWTVDHQLNGLSWVLARFHQPAVTDADDRVFNRVPEIEFVMKGMKVTFPNPDTSTDETARVTQWTDNAAAIRWWWLVTRRGVAESMLDVPSFRSAYARCEKEVTVVLPSQFSAYQSTSRRYTANGIVESGESVPEIEAQLDLCWQGFVVEVGDKLFFRPGVPVADRVTHATITDDDITRTVQITPYPPLQERVNVITGSLRQSSVQDYDAMDLVPFEDTAQAALDRQERSLAVEYRFVSEPITGGRLMAIHAKRLRERKSLTITVMPGDNFERHTMRPFDVVPLIHKEAGYNVATNMQIDQVIKNDDESLTLALRVIGIDTYKDSLHLPPLLDEKLLFPGSERVPDVINFSAIGDSQVASDGTIGAIFRLSWDAEDVFHTLIQVDGRTVGASPDNTFIVSGLILGQEYTIRARHEYSGGRVGKWAVLIRTFASDIIAPDVTNFSAIGDSQVASDGTIGAIFRLSWDAEDVFHTLIQVDGRTVGASPDNTFIVTGLIAGQEYTIRARHEYSGGIAGKWAVLIRTVVGDIIAPGNITGVGLFHLPAGLKISWTNPSDKDLDHVNIFLGTSGDPPKIAEATGTSYNALDLIVDTEYNVRLQPVDRSGNVGSKTVAVSKSTLDDVTALEIDIRTPDPPVVAVRPLGIGSESLFLFLVGVTGSTAAGFGATDRSELQVARNLTGWAAADGFDATDDIIEEVSGGAVDTFHVHVRNSGEYLFSARTRNLHAQAGSQYSLWSIPAIGVTDSGLPDSGLPGPPTLIARRGSLAHETVFLDIERSDLNAKSIWNHNIQVGKDQLPADAAYATDIRDPEETGDTGYIIEETRRFRVPGKSWRPNEHSGKILFIHRGLEASIGEVYTPFSNTILSNTADELTVMGDNYRLPPDLGSEVTDADRLFFWLISRQVGREARLRVPEDLILKGDVLAGGEAIATNLSPRKRVTAEISVPEGAWIRGRSLNSYGWGPWSVWVKVEPLVPVPPPPDTVVLNWESADGDGATRLFVVDTIGDELYEIDPDGVDTEGARLRQFPSGLTNPLSMTVLNGRLLIADNDGDELYEIDPDVADIGGANTEGTRLRRFPSGLSTPSGMTVLNGRLLIVNIIGYELWAIDPDGADTEGTRLRDLPSGLTSPLSMTVLNGRLFIADTSGDELWEIDPDGADTEGTRLRALPSRLTSPEGMTAMNGRLFIADTIGDELWEINPDGTANEGTRLRALPSGLTSPRGMAVLADVSTTKVRAFMSWGFVADVMAYEHRWRELNPDRTVHKDYSPWLLTSSLYSTIEGVTRRKVLSVQVRSTIADLRSRSATQELHIPAINSSPPRAPVLALQRRSPIKFRASWLAIIGAAGYEYRYRVAQRPFDTDPWTLTTDLEVTIGGQTANTTIWFEVRTVDQNGASKSVLDDIRLTTGTSLPEPTGLLLTEISGGYRATFNAVPGATSYEWYSSLNFVGSSPRWASATGTLIDVLGLERRGPWRFSLRATSPTGVSGIVTATISLAITPNLPTTSPGDPASLALSGPATRNNAIYRVTFRWTAPTSGRVDRYRTAIDCGGGYTIEETHSSRVRSTTKTTVIRTRVAHTCIGRVRAENRVGDSGYVTDNIQVPPWPQTVHADAIPHSDHSDAPPHNDRIAHRDAPPHSDHSDAIPHNDHRDHGDTPIHNDTPHSDESHIDTIHADAPAHSDHDDAAHVDRAHKDSNSISAHLDSIHSDAKHANTSHGDFRHKDSRHGDRLDIHGLYPEHIDVDHTDVDHGDFHSDSIHVDSPHQDTPGHSDHADVAHDDSPHDDTPHVNTGAVRVPHGDDAHDNSPHGDHND